MVPAAPAAPAAPIATTTPADASSEAPAGHPGSPHGEGGISLPAGLRLHGRFDLALEHTGYRDQPFQEGETRFRNYHHFLFLSRDTDAGPVGLHVELVDLTFYELQFRHRFAEQGMTLTAKAGKVLVPFGAEPLFHHNYGGRAGFDQRFLPPVWAQLGARVGLRKRFKRTQIGASIDLYAVRGYALDAPDDLLNLQSDFSDAEDMRFAFGQRLALSYHTLTGYYSLQYNALGFGRHLVMQAIDVGLWRVPGVPLLEDLTLDIGFVRADVSGAGPGADYYHFGSYLQLRYYPAGWFYVQYRQGLQTFGNRRGAIIDDTRLDGLDNSTHNVGLVTRHGGLSVGLYQFWFLEKAAEVDDDLTRLVVAYDF